MDEQAELTSDQTPDETQQESLFDVRSMETNYAYIPRELRGQFDGSPVNRIEIVCLFLIVVLCDVAIYRGSGFAGYAALVSGVAALLAAGVPTKRPQLSTWLFGVLAAGKKQRQASTSTPTSGIEP